MQKSRKGFDKQLNWSQSHAGQYDCYSVGLMDRSLKV